MQSVLALVIACALTTLSYVIGRKVKNKVKDMPYECGIAPTGDARGRFSVKFYLVAMLFILFDIEAIFLYPWAVVYKQLKMFAFVEMLAFVALIMAGFFFVWKKGVLDWAVTLPTDSAVPPARVSPAPIPFTASFSFSQSTNLRPAKAPPHSTNEKSWA